MNYLFKTPFLYVILNADVSGTQKVLNIAKAAITCGVKILQLRKKIGADKEFCELALMVRKLVHTKMTKFLINDRVDIALLCGADGVHLGQNDLPVEIARKIFGKKKIIGKSCHTLKEALETDKSNVDYIAIGPIFSTYTKSNLPEPVGRKLIKVLKQKIAKPIVAIGGINLDNINQVVNTGADGIAVISAISNASNPEKTIKLLVNAISNIKVGEIWSGGKRQTINRKL